MSVESADKNWKLQLRYGHLSTPFTHYTVIANGLAGALEDGFECCPGSAFMAMNVWTTDADEAADMIRVIGKQIGFDVTGRIQIYDTESEVAPGEHPHGYGIKFTPYG